MARVLVFLACSLILIVGGVEAKAELQLTVSLAKLIRLHTPVKTVIIGNPKIVDAVVRDRSTLVLTGYQVGSTNLVILDEQGEVIADETVVVRAYEAYTLFVHRGTVRTSYSCTPKCVIAANVGDSPNAFEKSIEQNTAKMPKHVK